MEINYHYILSSENWIAIIFFIILTILVFVRLKESKRLNFFFSILISDKYFNIYQKPIRLIYNFFTISLFVILLLSFSMTLLLFNNKMNNLNTFSFSLYTYLLCNAFLFIFGRYILGKFLGFIFNIEDLHKKVTFLKVSYLNFIGVAIFPLLLINFYTASVNSYFIYIIIGFVIILLALFYAYIVKVMSNVIFKNLFYFILYLCTLEITPLVIFIKLITKLK